MITKYPMLEERAAAVRLAAGIHGLGHLLDAELLARWGKPLVRIRRCPYADEAAWMQGIGGESRITIPDRCGRWGTARRVTHEFAHGLLDVKLIPILMTATEEELRRNPLVAQARQREEQLADEWALAVWLPHQELKASANVDELQRLTALPRSIIGRRLRRVENEHFELTYVPAWSSARSVRLEYRSAPSPRLVYFQGDTPLVNVPVDDSNRHSRLMKMKGDLLALRERELLVKYGLFKVKNGGSVGQCLRPRECRVDLAELQQWAREETEGRERLRRARSS